MYADIDQLVPVPTVRVSLKFTKSPATTLTVVERSDCQPVADHVSTSAVSEPFFRRVSVAVVEASMLPQFPQKYLKVPATGITLCAVASTELYPDEIAGP